ncbi:thiamine pyrophosphate-binding protein [Streptomyces sp. NBC_00047]|uniref:thiamine pyrophosphate-binding protein n=1 Tax=Streptomyces sp. NBC_00047 TaxID=2975627 RepID=UPI002B1DFFC8|nr:thiamine pyrophosphate-binding protein [Streptomyces sp. NBC_00047]
MKADYLLQRLREWGVEHVLAYPVDGINGFLAARGRAGDRPRCVQARHEEMTAFPAGQTDRSATTALIIPADGQELGHEAPAHVAGAGSSSRRRRVTRLAISDHFHPWKDAQGNSPLVWSMIGPLSQAVDLPVNTWVSCPPCVCIARSPPRLRPCRAPAR